MSKEKRLGRGLSALFESEIEEDQVQEKPLKGEMIENISVDQLNPGQYQPRKRFDEESLQELADSIIEQGLMQPIIVRKSENNFEIINNLNQFVDLGYPVMLGASRKSFIGITLDVPEDKRVEGSLAANIIGFQKGVSVFRVHDVNQTRKALTITKKIFNSDHLIN